MIKVPVPNSHASPNANQFMLTVRIRAVPGAKRTQAMGGYVSDEEVSPALRLRVAAPPIEGRANEAIVAWLAQTFAVRRSQVELASGQTGRAKRFVVKFENKEALTAAQLCWTGLLAAG